MTRAILPDFWFLRRGVCHTRYVCPLLMVLSAWLYRLCGKRVVWTNGDPIMMTEITPKGKKWEAPCLFPKALILLECRFWNSRIGLRIRSRKG